MGGPHAPQGFLKEQEALEKGELQNTPADQTISAVVFLSFAL